MDNLLAMCLKDNIVNNEDCLKGCLCAPFLLGITELFLLVLVFNPYYFVEDEYIVRVTST